MCYIRIHIRIARFVYKLLFRSLISKYTKKKLCIKHCELSFEPKRTRFYGRSYHILFDLVKMILYQFDGWKSERQKINIRRNILSKILLNILNSKLRTINWLAKTQSNFNSVLKSHIRTLKCVRSYFMVPKELHHPNIIQTTTTANCLHQRIPDRIPRRVH